MKVKEAVVLAGGLGTRLQGEIPDLPKCLAPISGQPFIDFVINYLLRQRIEKVVFSLGYKADLITYHLEQYWRELDYEYTIENTPLGTGGGLRMAVSCISGDTFFVVNGDTLFDVNLSKMEESHVNHDHFVTIALKPMNNYNRYGSVELNESNIVAFNEKRPTVAGLINGGVYLIEKQVLSNYNVGHAFSFEKEVLEPLSCEGKIGGVISDGYFIDIGVPEDYKRAIVELTLQK